MDYQEMDLSLNEEFLNSATEIIQECLSEMQQHWAARAATNAAKRKDWKEVLGRLHDAPVYFKIRELRRDISVMWDKCFIGQRERDRFSGFCVDEYSEELLLTHKNVLEKLNAYYIQHKEIIEMISKYEEMWKSVLHIQERSNDPERLFKNRGAALLKEEQDRKLIAKIPVMQKAILKALLKKESEGVVFLIRGQHFADLIKDHIIKKEEKRNLKRTPEHCLISTVSSKKKRLEDNITYGPSTKKTHNEENNRCEGSKVVKNLKWH